MSVKVPQTIVLEHPIEYGSQTITEIVIERRLKTGDLTGISASNQSVDDLIMVASRLCGQPTKVLKEMDLEDSVKIIALVTEFLAPFREIGGE